MPLNTVIMKWFVGNGKKPSTGGNPDPRNFKVLIAEPIGDYWLFMVEYPGCTNFEGKKILVWKGEMIQDVLDPHFNERSGLLARFRPDAWNLATKFVESL